MSVVTSLFAGFVTTFAGHFPDQDPKDGDLAHATFSSGTEDIVCLADGSMLLTDASRQSIRLIQRVPHHLQPTPNPPCPTPPTPKPPTPTPPTPTPEGEGTSGSKCQGERGSKHVLE